MNGEWLQLEAPLPKDLKALQQQLKNGRKRVIKTTGVRFWGGRLWQSFSGLFPSFFEKKERRQKCLISYSPLF
jgi:hypothetical protein